MEGPHALSHEVSAYIYIYILIRSIHEKLLNFILATNLICQVLFWCFIFLFLQLSCIFIVWFTAAGGRGGKNLSLKLEFFTLESHNKKKSKSSIRSSSSTYYSSSLATSTPGKEFKIIYSQMPLSKFPMEIECLKLDLHLSGFLVTKTTIKSSL